MNTEIRSRKTEAIISKEGARVAVVVVPTNEEIVVGAGNGSDHQ